MNTEEKKVLVAYFSASGVTQAVAQQIANATNGTLVEIEPTEKYSAADLDWHDEQCRSSVEMKDATARPAIKDTEVKCEEYDVIFLGFPIWWDEAPRAVNTFIETKQLDGKVVVPFVTAGSSLIDNSEKVLKQSYPQIQWQAGKKFTVASEAANWAKSFVQ